MFVPVSTPPQASAAAMELGQRLINVIEEYRQGHPGLSAQDVRLALRIASQHSAANAVRVRLIIMVTLGLLVAGLLLFLNFAQR